MNQAAVDCARRGANCDARYQKTTQTSTATIVDAASFNDTVTAFKSRQCELATRLCVKVKREAACCAEAFYDECHAVCVYKNVQNSRHLYDIIMNTPRGFDNWLDEVSPKWQEGPSAGVCKAHVEEAMGPYEKVGGRSIQATIPEDDDWEGNDEDEDEIEYDEEFEHDEL